MVKSAVRAIGILQCIAAADGGCLHAEIAASLQIPRGSLTALLRDLCDLRYVDYDAATRRYSLGAQVLELSHAFLRNLNIVRVGEPILQDIFRQVQEFTSLVIAKDTEVVKVCEYAVPDPLAYHLQVGESGPMHATAGGKALLAFLPSQLREHVLGRLDFRVYTPHTIRDRAVLEAELDRIRSGAAAYCREEYLEGMVSMALPVFNAENRAVAAIGINSRSVRFTPAHEERIEAALRAGTARLSTRLGCRRPPVATPARRPVPA